MPINLNHLSFFFPQIAHITTLNILPLLLSQTAHIYCRPLLPPHSFSKFYYICYIYFIYIFQVLILNTLKLTLLKKLNKVEIKQPSYLNISIQISNDLSQKRILHPHNFEKKKKEYDIKLYIHINNVFHNCDWVPF